MLKKLVVASALAFASMSAKRNGRKPVALAMRARRAV